MVPRATGSLHSFLLILDGAPTQVVLGPKTFKDMRAQSMVATKSKGTPGAAGSKGGKSPKSSGKGEAQKPGGAAKGSAASAAKGGVDGKRKLGLRGAAPWAARHAAKHAAEARARAAEPPLPGSARATIRVPTGAEDIKARIADLHNALVQIKGFRKNLAKGFFDVGRVLKDVQLRRLYEAKGYGTFEAFLEREIDLGKTMALRLVRIASIFQKDAALEHGMDRVVNALVALEVTTAEDAKSGRIPPPPPSTGALPIKPPGR
jgi:hypothetical protein